VRFTETKLKDARIIDLERFEDDRGFFARVWCRREFDEAGLMVRVAQANISATRKRGAIRGMHYQLPPVAEVKVIRCTRGAIYDVIVDVRPNSSTYREWLGVELTAENGRILYVPEGFAHGFQTLTDDVEAFYLVSQFYSPEHERGARYDDPAFEIEWPLEVTVISDKDLSWPDFAPDEALQRFD
jgi:dTDP-4-dehydrorhamnose 3,5-epimerase